MILYDSTNAADIPASAQAVAGYVNGAYAWTNADWHYWSKVPTLRIDVLNQGVGNVLDVERGDATPADAPLWLNRARARGIALPLIYCSLAAFPAVIDAFARTGVPEGGYWIADWTGLAHQVTPPASIVQYADPAHGSGGHYDVSTVFDPHVLSTPWWSPPLVPIGPAWVLQYVPPGVPLPATVAQLVTVTVHAPDAASAEAQVPAGGTLFAVHGPLAD